jgi:Sushi repeat (SCR repeat)
MPNIFAALIFFAFFATYSEAMCPFPGAPRNGFAKVHGHELLDTSVNNITAFNSRDTITYECNENWEMPSKYANPEVICQKDGTWKGSVPKCCKFL